MDVAWAIPEFHPRCSFLVECKSRIELSDHTALGLGVKERIP
jgi:hypothetical protein